ncbi:MAG: sugar phosphate isomerase/epimerase [Clostridiaceae bacterium]|nr:sugar phosphate isomerase/epimerase [Clostridiaceae bacterium]
MEIGISTACFYPVYTEETFKIISDLGCNLCEIFLEAEHEYDKNFTALLNDKMQKYNIRAKTVHAFCATFEQQLFSEYERRRYDALKVYKKVLQAAVDLGAKSYTFHGDRRCDNLDNLDFECYVKNLNELLDIASYYDVALSWENVAWCQTSRPEFIQRVKSAAPSLKFTLDIKQARRANVLPEEYISAMGDSLINVHVNDFNGEKSCMLPGRGEYDFKKLLDRLKGIGYKGNAIIEVYSSDYNDYSELKTSMEYLKGLL